MAKQQGASGERESRGAPLPPRGAVAWGSLCKVHSVWGLGSRDSRCPRSATLYPQYCTSVAQAAHATWGLLPSTRRGAGLPRGQLGLPGACLFSFSAGRAEKFPGSHSQRGKSLRPQVGTLCLPSLGVTGPLGCAAREQGLNDEFPSLAVWQAGLDPLLLLKVSLWKEAERIHELARLFFI